MSVCCTLSTTPTVSWCSAAEGAEVDAGGGEHGLAQLAGEIGPMVGNNAAGRAVTRENVRSEDVEHLL